MIEEAYETLANAVVLQAVKDYRYAKKHSSGEGLKEIEKFFLSEWFIELTDVDGSIVLEKLQEE